MSLSSNESRDDHGGQHRPSSNDATTAERLTRIEQRLAWIETTLGLEPSGRASGTTGDVDRGSRVGTLPPNDALDRHGYRGAPAQAATDSGDAVRPPLPPPPPAAPPTRRADPSASVPQRTPRRPLDLEAFLGGRAAAWVGAVLIVMAAGFGFRLAWQAGLFGMVSPTVRCLALGLFGLSLIAGGEVVLRWIGRAGAVGLFAAGLAIMYLAVWVSFGFFDVLAPDRGFILLALVALAGYGLTLRGRMLSIGVLSVLGGYVSPVLASDAANSAAVVALPTFLTVLFVLALALSWRAPRPFRPLRYVAFIAHLLIGGVWALSVRENAPAIVFGTLWWGLTVGESLLITRRRQAGTASAAMVLAATAGYLVLGLVRIPELLGGSWDPKGLFPFALAAVAGALAAQFGTGLEAFRHARPRFALDRLTIALGLSSIVLAALAIGLQFRDLGQVIGWLVLGAATVEAGRRLRSRWLDVFGIGIAVTGLARAMMGSLGGPVQPPLALLSGGDWGTIEISGWAILRAVAVAATLATAARLRLGESNRSSRLLAYALRSGVLAIALLAWIGSVADAATGWGAVWLFIVSASLSMIPADRQLGAVVPAWFAVLQLIAGVTWSMVCLTGTLGAIPPQAMEPMLLHPGMLTSAITAALFALFGWRDHRTAASQPEPIRVKVEAAALRPMTPPRRPRHVPWFEGMFVAGWLVLLLTASIDIVRAVMMDAPPLDIARDFIGPLEDGEQRTIALCWAITWSAIAVAIISLARVGQWRGAVAQPLQTGLGIGVLMAAALLWLTGGSLVPRVFDGPAIPESLAGVFSLQFIAAVALVLALLVTPQLRRTGNSRVLRHEAPADRTKPQHGQRENMNWRNGPAFGVLMFLVSLVALTLMLERLILYTAVDPESWWHGNANLAVQTTWSALWAVAAIAAIVVGFLNRSPLARWGGLVLLGCTLVKVIAIDLAGVGTGWRVMSLLVVGSLFVLTSLAYGRLARDGTSDKDNAVSPAPPPDSTIKPPRREGP